MATIKDVAKRANLSVATVSRFLNNHPYVTDEKKEKIQQAMDELNYVPSSIATQLRSKKNSLIGVLVSRITNPFFTYLIDSIERHAKHAGYKVLVMQTYDDEKIQDDMISLLKQKMICGLIMCSIEGDDQLLAKKVNNQNIVLCNEFLPNATVPQINTDQNQATYDAVRYLVAKGYKRIAYCTGGTLANKSHGDRRTNGFERALLDFDLPFKRSWIFKQTHSIEDGKKVAQKLLALPEADRPNAIFTSSDEVASGVLSIMQQHSISVPESFAIIGFDDQPFASLLSIPLTTIAQPIEALGRESIKQLIAMLENTTCPIDDSDLQLSLVIRQSA